MQRRRILSDFDDATSGSLGTFFENLGAFCRWDFGVLMGNADDADRRLREIERRVTPRLVEADRALAADLAGLAEALEAQKLETQRALTVCRREIETHRAAAEASLRDVAQSFRAAMEKADWRIGYLQTQLEVARREVDQLRAEIPELVRQEVERLVAELETNDTVVAVAMGNAERMAAHIGESIKRPE